ncbi:MAG: hypothetical protein ACLP9L_19145 [Thermoguttaceae bacterium]|jgi:hypothetical protein
MKGLVGGLSFATAILSLIALWAAVSAGEKKTQDVAKTATSAGNSPAITRLLAIPARRQWDDNAGYCGETCIQSLAMYYGTYISQYQVRAMIHADQRHELVISENGDEVLKNLRLTYQEWDSDRQPAPQYRAYLAWTKQQLRDGHPVIGTAYAKDETDPDYDHILPFIGFRSAHDAANYYDDDELVLYDNYARSSFIRPFSTMAAARSEVTEGAGYACYIPRNVDYGCAVTGIVDPHHETVPVQLSIDRWDEPDVVAGENAVTLHATLTIESLVPGRAYSLLRYDDYRQVPDAAFLAKGGYAWKHGFTAKGATQTIADTFLSSACVIYRCVAD